MTKVEQTQKNEGDERQRQRLDSHQPEASVGQIIRDLGEPLVIDPGMAGDGEGVAVIARQLVMLEEIFGIS